jgi:hypothetical protein
MADTGRPATPSIWVIAMAALDPLWKDNGNMQLRGSWTMNMHAPNKLPDRALETACSVGVFGLIGPFVAG